MLSKEALAVISDLSAGSLGVFRGAAAVESGVSRKQLAIFKAQGVIERELPDVFRVAVVERSADQRLRGALLWAGDGAAGACRSAGETYRLEGVQAPKPEIVVPDTRHMRSGDVVVYRSDAFPALMIREQRGLRVTGVEATLVALAGALDAEAFEIACEDARRRRLTTVPALRAYLERFGRRGLPGVRATRELLSELDPTNAARSTLEVKTRRLLAASGFKNFVREFPLKWNGRTYRFDFAFESMRTILETNGRRWHDDPTDCERDNEKWSIPGRHGYRIVFATWDKVTCHPDDLIAELSATFASRAVLLSRACPSGERNAQQTPVTGGSRGDGARVG